MADNDNEISPTPEQQERIKKLAGRLGLSPRQTVKLALKKYEQKIDRSRRQRLRSIKGEKE
ncbi:MAG: hypothetical protein WA021_01310 [Minisyncoccia bacterium]